MALGIVPLLFANNDSADSLGLTGREQYDFAGLRDGVLSDRPIAVTARGDDREVTFHVRADAITGTERPTLAGGGLYRKMLTTALDAERNREE